MKKIKLLKYLLTIILLFLFTFHKNSCTFFKTDAELFLEDFLPLEFNRVIYKGDIIDSSNHMEPMMDFGQYCLPTLKTWRMRIKKGDTISKSKNSTTLIIHKNLKIEKVNLDTLDINLTSLPCECSKLK